jgi:hypothetical protein
MTHRLRLLLVCVLLAISGPLKGVAEDASNKEIRIGFGALLDGADPIAGTAICKIGKTCHLIDKESPKMRVELTLDYNNGWLVSEMQVRCEDACSLENGRSVKTFQTQRKHHLFGDERGLLDLLVSKPRKTIGKILLIYPDP